MEPTARVTCSTCGLRLSPQADAMCPACGMPVTVDVRASLPAPTQGLPTVDELARKLEAQRTPRRPERWGRQAGPGAIVVAVMVVVVLRFAFRLLGHWLSR